MALEIRQLEPTKSNMLKFVHYPIDVLYKNHPVYIPTLVLDEVDTLLPTKNPAFDFCESIYFMAYRDGKPVGRIAGIINKVVNERTGKQEARFGFIDFIDDEEVVDALMAKVTEWAKGKGMNRLTGPLGFTDMDREGCLVEGFDKPSTQATIYNYPYYKDHFERLGFEKEVDWIELRVMVPDEIPPKMVRVANIVRQRYNLTTVKMDSRKKLADKYGKAIFELINEAYDQLFGYSPLTERQIQHYINIYLPLLPLDHISLVVDQDEQLVGVGISIPSIAKALIKTRGRYFPFGWVSLLRAIKGHTECVDLMLIAVKPEYQSKGLNALFFTDLLPVYMARGYKWAESNPEMELNSKVRAQWDYFETEQHHRRRAYTKEI